MSKNSRLQTALDQGAFEFSGPIAVLRPPADYDLPVAPDQVLIEHTFKPDCDAWDRRGYQVMPKASPAEAMIVVLPRAKALARDMVARACNLSSGIVIIDGQKTDGADAVFKECRKRLGDLPSLTKAHGRLFWFDADAAKGKFDDWLVPDPARGDHGYYTTAGVFSDGQVDRGSALLVDALPPKLFGRVADLGAGWGYLSLAALKYEKVKSVDLVEAEALALDCARLNVTDERANFHWADATTFAPSDPYDTIICNPPFHTSRAADPALGRAFIAAAARMLKPSGHLWLVANRHLPYERHLKDTFRNGEELYGDNSFKLFHASRPKR